MPRKPMSVNESAIDILRKLIKSKTQLECDRHSDILELRSMVINKLGEYLSVQTLNRFFGLIKNDFNPSVSTLNVLARFVNYDSFKELESFEKSKANHTPISVNITRLIAALFKNVETENYNDAVLLRITKNLLQLVENDLEALPELYTFMSSTEFGRTYFFQQFENIDALNGHYGNGLHYYLLHTKDHEQQCFAYGILCYRYFLSNDRERFDLCFQKLAAHSEELVKTFHPAIVGRYFAAFIYNSVMHQTPIGTLCAAIEAQRTIALHAEHAFAMLEYTVGEALILAGEYQMAWEVLQVPANRFSAAAAGVREGYDAQYKFLQLYAGYYCGKINARTAKLQLPEIRRSSFNFLCIQYFTLLTHALETGLKLKKYDSDCVRRLMCSTGFSFLASLFKTNSNAHVYIMEINGKKIAN